MQTIESADARSGVTRLLIQLREGDQAAWDRLLPLVYEELRRIAHNQLRSQDKGHTLNTTALVHETYLKLVDQNSVTVRDRAHFFCLSARAMRHVLIDHARKRSTAKRGGGWRQLPLDDAEIPVEETADILLALDEALTRLSGLNDRMSRVVECRFFGGMTEQETAEALGVTDRTVRREWTKARLWLYSELQEKSA
jgi:RNA polymerase sigma factor (TIGR02999 family)